ncbi:MAG: hypothetical protein JXA30_00850 [Deltaproteobacteria bacterium]|nr:hypothetical protein [Deltaproteobacteria bacterium]
MTSRSFDLCRRGSRWFVLVVLIWTWTETTAAQDIQNFERSERADEGLSASDEEGQKAKAETDREPPSETATHQEAQDRQVLQPEQGVRPPKKSPETKYQETEDEERLGPLERLPKSAYPEPRVRGIKSGSLWMTFHGLQWPYYRKSGIGISGYVWIDTGYERAELGNPDPTYPNEKRLLQEGRLLLRVTPSYSSGRWFVQGQGELVANKDQSQDQVSSQLTLVDVDDVWIRAGMWDAFDVQLGRFEAWEVYHFGMGLDLNTQERLGARYKTDGVPDIYGVTDAFYRPPNIGQAAVHIYPTDYLRFELGGQIGNEDVYNGLAVRPVGVLDLGWVKLKLGGEYKMLSGLKDGDQAKKEKRGAGAALQFVVDPHIEFGANGAYGLVDTWGSDGAINEKGSYDIYSLGGFANGRIVGDLILGAGVNLTQKTDIHYDLSVDDYGHFDHFQTFVALQYIFIKHLYIKLVLAYAKGNVEPTFGDPVFSNTMLSGRLRLMYMF